MDQRRHENGQPVRASASSESDGPSPSADGARRLAQLCESIHSISYYCREINDLTRGDTGKFKGWWHAYFAYRPAPMGPVSAEAVTAAFYNFAPRMVERAVPGVWSISAPEAVCAQRAQLVDKSLRRVYASSLHSQELAEAAALSRQAIEGCDVAGRVLFGSYTSLEWPTEAHNILWHACTLLREHRGDGHNIALAAAGVDGAMSHVLMAARGFGNRPTIQGIRGWTDAEWQAATEALQQRGWIQEDGSQTELGRKQRTVIERHTDRLASEPTARLGETGTARLEELLTGFVKTLLAGGEVSGRWPPPTVMQADSP